MSWYVLTRAAQKRCTDGCGNRSIPSCGWHCAGCLCLSSLLHPGSSTQSEPGGGTFMKIEHQYWRTMAISNRQMSKLHLQSYRIWLGNHLHWNSCRQCCVMKMAVGVHDVVTEFWSELFHTNSGSQLPNMWKDLGVAVWESSWCVSVKYSGGCRSYFPGKTQPVHNKK